MENKNIIHQNIRIAGRVQGVGFRYGAKKIADELNITGFASNLSDGDVYIEAEGSEDKIKEFVKWCFQGPVRAIVKSVDYYNGDNKGFKDFNIK